MKKGDKINYRMVPIGKDVENFDSVNIMTEGAINTTKNSCGKDGCDFTVEATADGPGSIYLGEDTTLRSKETIVEEFKTSITKKVREGDEMYFSTKLSGKKAYKLLVNTPNVIVYTANQKKC